MATSKVLTEVSNRNRLLEYDAVPTFRINMLLPSSGLQRILETFGYEIGQY